MLLAAVALQGVTLIAVLIAVLRHRAPVQAPLDPRFLALLAADLPAQHARAQAQGEAFERQLRTELAQLRQDSAEASARGRDSFDVYAAGLRRELLDGLHTVGATLHTGLHAFRGDHKADAERLRTALDAQLAGLEQRLGTFTSDTHKHHTESREALHGRLTDLQRSQGEHQERLRATVEGRLDRLNEANAAKLEEMRATVDEKLHSTLQTRLTESFGAVTDQLTKVHTGLGEMSKLSANVGDLSRIFTNVKSRGGFAEVQLGMLLEQMLAPGQFAKNVKVKANTAEMVEYAVTLPTAHGEVLLPIDAKFPREAWERLETAYAEHPEEVPSARKAFESAIRTEGKRICDKYIAPPTTTSFAIMFLPTEGLYAEVMRRDGLQADIQQNCRVTIAGPSTLSALLNSFQMGFHMLHMQQKGDEVWKVLADTRVQFGKFEDLMTKMDDQVTKVQKTIQEVGTRTRVINRTLRDIKVEGDSAKLTNGAMKTSFDGLLPMLTAAGEEL